MRARIKADKKVLTVYACRRVMFFHDRWTDVPPGYEDDARANPLLEIEPEQAEMVMPPASGAQLIRGHKKGGKA